MHTTSGSKLFSTLIENTCLQMDCCRLTGYFVGRNVVHRFFSRTMVKKCVRGGVVHTGSKKN